MRNGTFPSPDWKPQIGQHVDHHRRQRLAAPLDECRGAGEQRQVGLLQQVGLPVSAKTVGSRQDAERLLDALLEAAGTPLVEHELEGRAEDALGARDDPLHRGVALLLDRVRLRIGAVRLHEEVLELETGGERRLRAERGQLGARPRDVDPVVQDVALAVQREEGHEDAGLRPIGQLLERDDAHEAVPEPDVVAPDEQVVVEQAPDGRGVGRVGELLDDRPGQRVPLAPSLAPRESPRRRSRRPSG